MIGGHQLAQRAGSGVPRIGESRFSGLFPIPKEQPPFAWCREQLPLVMALSAAAVLFIGDGTASAQRAAGNVAANAVEPDGTTPLHRAAHRNDTKAADALIRAGADVNAENRYGIMPLSLACTNGNGALVELLLEGRVARVTDAWSGLASYYDTEVAPIERVLLRYRDDPELVERISVALVREANRVELEPRLLLAVLLVENPWIDPSAKSFVGAQGLMQVMPFHRGQWKPCEPRLDDIDANICHGAQIFAHYFKRSGGNVDRALLRYNGCVNGTNTPDCHRYPYHVFARAGRASILAWLDAPEVEPRLSSVD